MADYPQSEKLAAAQEERVTLANFLDWLDEQDITLAKYDEESGLYLPPLEHSDTIIMRYLDIDEKALEQERRAMLAALRGDS